MRRLSTIRQCAGFVDGRVAQDLPMHCAMGGVLFLFFRQVSIWSLAIHFKVLELVVAGGKRRASTRVESGLPHPPQLGTAKLVAHSSLCLHAPAAKTGQTKLQDLEKSPLSVYELADIAWLNSWSRADILKASPVQEMSLPFPR